MIQPAAGPSGSSRHIAPQERTPSSQWRQLRAITPTASSGATAATPDHGRARHMTLYMSGMPAVALVTRDI